MIIALLIAIVISLAVIRHQGRKEHEHICRLLDHLDERLQKIEEQQPEPEEKEDYGSVIEKLGPISEGMCKGSKELVLHGNKCKICSAQFSGETVRYARMGNAGMRALAPPHFPRGLKR